MNIDFATVGSSALANAESLLVEWFPNGRKIGGEFRIGDVHGVAGNSLAVSLAEGAWQDFATGERGGDLISLLAAHRGIKQIEAAQAIQERLNLPMVNGTAPVGSRPRPTAAPADDWISLPAAADVPAPQTHPQRGTPTARWAYYDLTGGLVGYVWRFDHPDGKIISPLSWCRHINGDLSWRWKHFPKPRVLYNLGGVAARPSDPVLIVEGEKTADAASALLPGYVCVSWPGGSQAVRHADWSPLLDRNVLVWPDADQAGRDAAVAIAACLPDAVVIHVPEGWVDGYDLADAARDGWTTARCETHIAVERQRLSDEYEATRRSEPEVVQIESEPPAPAEADLFTEAPFRVLGYDRGVYFYLPQGSLQITRLQGAQHTKANLLTIAPRDFWDTTFAAGKSSTDWTGASNALIQSAHRAGLFSPEKIRGRGCWADDSGDAPTVVFHGGDRLIVNGVTQPITGFPSKFLYEKSIPFGFEIIPAAGNTEAARLLALCSLLPFRTPLDAKLLAGWCAVAPVCGTLPWRPHIWLTGPAGSGKSWTLTNIVEQITGRFALKFQGSASEAGIRQSLACDARPVIIDEAESEDEASRIRFRAVMQLARQASTEGGGSIVKGSINGTAQEFHIRSAFCFASIGVAAVGRADTSRITVLTLTTPHDRASKFDRLRSEWSGVMDNPDFGAMIQCRSIAKALAIRENSAIFARAVALRLGDQRTGDQLGTLLAGAFSLTSTKLITPEAAAAWVAAQDWAGYETEDADKDENQAFSRLLQHIVNLTPTKRVSVGDLLNRVFSAQTGVNDQLDAKDALNLIGIKPDEHGIFVSNSHPELAKIFKDSPWAGKWKDQLSRVEDSKSVPCCRFGGVRNRAVVIPKSAFLAPADT